MATIKWTDQSILDIENIASFISKDTEKYAKIQTIRFFDAANTLISHPKIGHLKLAMIRSGKSYKATTESSIK